MQLQESSDIAVSIKTIIAEEWPVLYMVDDWRKDIRYVLDDEDFRKRTSDATKERALELVKEKGETISIAHGSILAPEDEERRNQAIDIINQAIEKNRDLFDSETLFDGLKEYTEDMVITITDRDTFFSLDIFPKSGAGHDFGFTVDKDTLEVKDMAVGELDPDPEEEGQ